MRFGGKGISGVNRNGKAVERKDYANRPVGDLPELMPNNNSLFCDLKVSLDTHVNLTRKMHREDPRKFSKSTPKEISRAIHRLFDPVSGVAPTRARILQDINRIPLAARKIVQYCGGIVPGLADCNGHRRKKVRGNDKRTDVAKLSWESMAIRR